MKNNNIKSKNNYLLFVFSAVLICMLGTIFGVTYAYVSGAFSNNPSGSDNSSSQNPYLLAKLYYNDGTNDYLINQNGITGTVSADGSVSLKVSTTSGEKTVSIGENSTFNLPIKVKNEGNITGEILNASVSIEFLNSNAFVSNKVDETTYYFQFYSTNFTVQNNNVLSGNQEVASGASIQLLDSVKLNADEIDQSDLCGLNFVITVSVSFGQENFETINASV